jgi:hypothetical protein
MLKQQRAGLVCCIFLLEAFWQIDTRSPANIGHFRQDSAIYATILRVLSYIWTGRGWLMCPSNVVHVA